MQVDVQAFGQTRRLMFAANTYPLFEDAPMSSQDGADLPVDTVLRVKWDRLTFFARDEFLGDVEINILNKPSLGRVYSLANSRL